jgi:hypothetical protein
METKRCIPCAGSGKLMGGGMMINDCDHCRGSGKITQPNDEIDYLQLKTTESYKKAIDSIKSSDDKITHEKAEEMFKEEFDKIGAEKTPILIIEGETVYKYTLPEKVNVCDEVTLEGNGNGFVIGQAASVTIGDALKSGRIQSVPGSDPEVMFIAPSLDAGLPFDDSGILTSKKRGRPKK